MNGAFYIGATGLSAQQQGLDVIANNVANINTTGFKRSELRFSELLMQQAVQDGREPVVPPRIDSLSGVQTLPPVRVFEQGDLQQTSKPFDVAVTGDGYIELLGPAGQTYLWRGGHLKVNADGYLASEEGLLLKALIQVPDGSSSITIDRDGRVFAVTTASLETPEIGQILLAKVEDVGKLESAGNGYFKVQDEQSLSTANAGEDGVGEFVQGALESSNVDLSHEMVAMLLMQRAYAANAQSVQAADQLMAIANGLRR